MAQITYIPRLSPPDEVLQVSATFGPMHKDWPGSRCSSEFKVVYAAVEFSGVITAAGRSEECIRIRITTLGLLANIGALGG